MFQLRSHGLTPCLSSSASFWSPSLRRRSHSSSRANSRIISAVEMVDAFPCAGLESATGGNAATHSSTDDAQILPHKNWYSLVSRLTRAVLSSLYSNRSNQTIDRATIAVMAPKNIHIIRFIPPPFHIETLEHIKHISIRVPPFPADPGLVAGNHRRWGCYVPIDAGHFLVTKVQVMIWSLTESTKGKRPIIVRSNE